MLNHLRRYFNNGAFVTEREIDRQTDYQSNERRGNDEKYRKLRNTK